MEAERIHPQQPCSTRNADRSAPGRRKMIPEGNKDLYRRKKRLRNGKYVVKHKRLLFKKILKIIDSRKNNNLLWGLYAEIKSRKTITNSGRPK